MSPTPPLAAVNSVPPEYDDAAEGNDAGAEAQQTEAAAAEEPLQQNQPQTQPKWPGWPGDNVFRLIVPVVKVGSIIGRKGELIKKMCDETRARIRILEGPIGIPDRIVMISGKEAPEAILSPAMDALVRVFKRVSGLSAVEGDSTGAAIAGAAFCSIRLLVANSQAINLIGKQGSVIKSMQENTGASVRVLSEEELPSYATPDERIIEIHGEALKVLNALEAVIGHLRKFLVDHSVIPIFEKTYNATISQERISDARADKTQLPLASAPAPQIVIGSDYSLSLKRDPSIFEHEQHLDPKIPQSAVSLYGQDSALGGLRTTGLGRANAPVVTQMIHTMQVPLSYAEDIIGVRGSNIAYIRQTSGAILTIQESRGLPDEITVEIKGNTSQVQIAQQLIQEFISNRKEPTPNVYGKIDAGFSSYSQVPETSYTSHLGGYGSSSLGGYGSPGLGGYSSYRF